jgi:hypothetical protein
MAAAGVLSGCGDSSPATGGAGGSPAPGGSSRATEARVNPTCDLAPATLVNSVLGTQVGAPAAQELGVIVVCRYSPTSGSGAVVVRIQTDVSDELFTKTRQTSDANGLPTTDLPGFADKAYTSTLKAGSHVTNTVVALKGTVQILVSSPASFDAEKSLEEQLFAKLA